MKISKYLGPVLVLALGAQIVAGYQSAEARHGAVVRRAGIRTLAMVGPKAGWALETTTILTTTTDGSVWLNVTPPGVDITPASQLVALNASTAWVTATRTGSQSPIVLLRTTDTGHTWLRSTLPIPADAPDGGRLTFTDAQHGQLLVSLGAGAGSEGVQILTTSDGGAHWTTVSRTASGNPAPGSLPLSGIKTGLGFLNAGAGWATAEVAGPDNFSWLYRTTDGGHTWQHQTLTFPAPYTPVTPVTYPPEFFTPNVGILPVVLNTSNQTPAIDFFATRDGGKTWSSTTPLPYKSTTVSLTWDFGDANHGWAVWGKLLHVTTDGGRHWSTITPNLSFEHVTQLNFVNARVGWGFAFATDNHSLLLRTTDGGHTWKQITSYANDQPAGDVQIESAG